MELSTLRARGEARKFAIDISERSHPAKLDQVIDFTRTWLDSSRSHFPFLRNPCCQMRGFSAAGKSSIDRSLTMVPGLVLCDAGCQTGFSVIDRISLIAFADSHRNACAQGHPRDSLRRREGVPLLRRFACWEARTSAIDSGEQSHPARSGPIIDEPTAWSDRSRRQSFFSPVWASGDG